MRLCQPTQLPFGLRPHPHSAVLSSFAFYSSQSGSATKLIKYFHASLITKDQPMNPVSYQIVYAGNSSSRRLRLLNVVMDGAGVKST